MLLMYSWKETQSRVEQTGILYSSLLVTLCAVFKSPLEKLAVILAGGA